MKVPRAEKCFACGRVIADDERLVLLRRKIHQAHCSRACLEETAREHRRAVATTQRRCFVALGLVALLLGGARYSWRRYRAPQPEAIASSAPEELPPPPPVEPVRFGPAWPPTDADWVAAFKATAWVHPLPGPARRIATRHDRIFDPHPPNNISPRCRQAGACAVDLGGELWGEHVYAAHDGVIDRVQASGNEEGGGLYVRIAHFGGMVFTQYFHLAAPGRGIVRGARVRAGDVVGLLGDTGTTARRHLHFTLSVRPSLGFPEVYWDPEPWMEHWPVRVPRNGTVAGLIPPERTGAPARPQRSRQKGRL